MCRHFASMRCDSNFFKFLIVLINLIKFIYEKRFVKKDKQPVRCKRKLFRD